ncbi:MAG: acyl carrier protein [Muribaculaceae bacterium]|nr:acyl carrier protein [Muribaculaceae bacterium]
MELKEFIINFANQFEDTDPAEITAETEFRELDEWSSLINLGLIAMADEEYGVELSGAELRSAKTVGDLFEIIKAKR